MKNRCISFAAVATMMALVSCANQSSQEEFSELGKKPQTGLWYKVTPEGALTGPGEQWNGYFRKGAENKVVVYFCGGGVSVDEYTAARGASASPQESFYFDSLGDDFGKGYAAGLDRGIGSREDVNPFKDWTFVLLPYVTGDFHCGAGEREYTALDGSRKTIYYYGYTNFRKMMDIVAPYLGTPDALVITGSSAGGFGTAIMSDDVINYFPDTKNVTSIVDASVLVTDKWKQIARDEWKAPEHIVSRINGDNITLDCLKALHRDRPYVKIMFGITARDGILTNYQHYFLDGTRPESTREDGEAFQQIIAELAAGLQESDPECGLNIWDIGVASEQGLTPHTIEFSPEVLVDYTGNGSYADWMMNAVNGKVEKLGLERLQ